MGLTIHSFMLIICGFYIRECVLRSVEDDESFLSKHRYIKYDELLKLSSELEETYPHLIKSYSVGKSVEGRNLLVLQITEDVKNEHLDRPAFKFVANMHGDEAVGRELMIYLAQYLLLNYGKDDRVTKLVNTTDIHLMPSMNPDGFEISQEGNCESLPRSAGRNNAKGVDLNRDFPDQFDRHKSNEDEYLFGNRQPETLAIIRWVLSKQFVLSGNLHGGAVVASYPYDDLKGKECCEESRTPDDSLFRHLASVYASRHPDMLRGDKCPPENFTQGITNGAFWYSVQGGMQDFNYLHSNCYEVTFELSCCKYPRGSEMPSFWQMNKEPMLAFMEQTHIGVNGVVVDGGGEPVKDAKVLVEGIDHVVRTTETGNYWRMLLPGEYTIKVSAAGFKPAEPQTIVVPENQSSAIVANFTLQRRSRSITDDFVHHDYPKMEQFLKDLNDMYPNMTRLYSIGQSVEGRKLYVLEVTRDPGVHKPGKPEFKYVANMHGNEVIGREMLLLLAKYLCQQYTSGDERVQRILNNTRIHLMPSMNPDGYENSAVGDYDSLKGRPNAHNVDLNRNFPDQFGSNEENTVQEPETSAVMNWSLSNPFVLSANLHGGALVANYPFDANPDMKSGHDYLTPDNNVFVHLAHVYSDAHLKMHLGQPCKKYSKEKFHDGIVNGAEWYVLTGGMQDWNYLYTNDMELTLELGCFKFPPASDLPTYWEDNKEALLKYIEEVHKGVHGFVHSHIGHPLSDASISVSGIHHSVRTARDGDYWRLLSPGTYNVTAGKQGYESVTEQVTIPENGDVSVNFTLMADDPQHWSSAYDFRVLDNIVNTRYHKPLEMYALLSDLENKYPDIAEFRAGDNLVTAKFHQLKMTDQVGSPEETKFHIALTSSFYGSQPLGNEMLLNFARHIATAYELGEPIHKRLLQNAVLHFIPNIDVLYEKILKQYKGRDMCDVEPLEEEFGDSLYSYLTKKDMSPLTNYTREKAFIQLLQSDQYDMVLEMTSGSEDVQYPELSQSVKVYEYFAKKYQDNRTPSDKYSCSHTSNAVHGNLIDVLCERFKTPVIAVGLSCCKMPAEEDISWVWRNNLRAIMKFVENANTGIVGFIKNEEGMPMREALVAVAGIERQYRVSGNMANYKLMLPPGDYKVIVRCHNYQDQMFKWRVEEGTMKQKDVILRRVNAEAIPGGLYEEIKPGDDPNLIYVTGMSMDKNSVPLSHSTVTIVKTGSIKNRHQLAKNVSDETGRFILTLPLDFKGKDVLITAAVDGYITKERHISLNSIENVTPNVLFKLETDDLVLGMPRLVFVMLAGVIGVALVVMSAWCYSCRERTRESRKEYLFTQLPSDDKRPLCDDTNYEIVRKPYYDEEEIPPSETDSEDEEVVMLRSGNEWKSNE